jgi:N-acetylmuramoyl-L-alanine amidase
MNPIRLCKDAFSSCGSALSYWWYDVRVFWYTADKGPWIFGVVTLALISVFAVLVQAVGAHQYEQENVRCLALNVYFEARGEPEAGQYAVAEVTMNRVASGRYPNTVCGVVYQKNWDPLRKRYVGAFSWTEFQAVPNPTGEAWQRAWDVAEAVYYHRRAPTLAGATHYHATYITPSWAENEVPVARIGQHVFYP